MSAQDEFDGLCVPVSPKRWTTRRLIDGKRLCAGALKRFQIVSVERLDTRHFQNDLARQNAPYWLAVRLLEVLSQMSGSAVSGVRRHKYESRIHHDTIVALFQGRRANCP